MYKSLIKMRLFLLFSIILAHTEAVPKPYIDSRKARHIVLGHDVELNCSVTMNFDVRIFPLWILPKDELYNDSRVIIGEVITEEVNVDGVESILGHKTLTIKNVTEKHQGLYVCSVKDLSGNKNEDHFTLQTFPADNKYLNISVQENVHIIAQAGTASVEWTVLVQAFPTPNLTWYNPVGEEIMHGSSSTEKYTVISKPFMTKLVINHLEVPDSGFYTLIAYNVAFKRQLEVFLYVTAHTEAVPKPHIDSRKARHIVFGHDVELNCSVTVNLDVRIFLHWILPKDELYNDSRVILGEGITKKVNVNGVESIVGHKTLTIKNVTEKHQGLYVCSVTDHSGNKNEDHFTLQTFSADNKYLNISVQENVHEIIAPAGTASVQWIVLVQAFPIPNLTWYNPGKEEIMLGSSNFGKYNVISEPFMTKLVINRLEILDSGVYSLIADNGAFKRQLNVSLYVRDRPSVKILNNHKYHLASSPQTIVCDVTAYPIPEITWIMNHCSKYPECSNDSQIIPALEYQDTVISSIDLMSEIIFAANETTQFTCEACNNLGCKKDTSIFVVSAHTKGVPEPQIDYQEARLIVLGHDVELNCSVLVNFDVNIFLHWILPKDELYKDSRVIIGEGITKKVNEDGVESIVGHKTLTIENVTEKHQGLFGCSVTYHSGNKNEDHFTFHTFPADDNYLNISVQENVHEIIAQPGTASVQWIVLVQAFPTPNLTWYNPVGEEIMHGSSSTEKYTVISEPSMTKLVINHLDIRDAGVYTLIADNGAFKRQLNVSLYVRDRPMVTVFSEDIYFLAGSPKEIECHVFAYPTPEITWIMNYCSNYPECSNDSQIIPALEYKVTVSSSNRFKSKINFTSNETTQFTCEACNSFGCEKNTSFFFVTDFADGFSIQGPDLVFETNDVVLECGASLYDHSSNLSWIYLVPHKSTPFPISQSHRYKLTYKKSRFSHILELMIMSVNKNDSGFYLCQANSLNTSSFQMKFYQLIVDPLISPYLISDLSNMNGSRWTTVTGHKEQWNCSIKSMPPATISWFKNNRPLILNKNETRIKVLNNNQTLLIESITLEDEGVYTCQAINKVGSFSISNELILSDKPGDHYLLISIFISLIILIISIIMVFWLACKVRKEKKLRRELTAAGLINFEEGAVESLNPDLGVQEQADLLPYNKKWEFPRDRLKIGKQLGSGAFGVVLLAEADGIIEEGVKTTVAVKSVQSNVDFSYVKALASELKIMIHLGKHLNVVNLLGACTKNLNKRELLVIIEYCKHGSLHNYLLDHRQDFLNLINPATGELDSSFTHSVPKYQELPVTNACKNKSNHQNSNKSSNFNSDSSTDIINTQSTSLHVSTQIGDDGYLQPAGKVASPATSNSKQHSYINTADLVCWAFQVARGMEYLASRKVMHGDLATRNILLTDDNIVKICDFGLSKSMYKSDNYLKTGGGPLPVKWMAPESIKDKVFSTQSDVWSYGIVLWEMFTLAKMPYPGIEDYEKLIGRLEEGYRLEKPAYAPDDVYVTMRECWETRPSLRPSFTSLAQRFGDLLDDRVRAHYINLNEFYLRINREEIETQGTDYLAMINSPTYVNTFPENEDAIGSLCKAGSSADIDEKDSEEVELNPMLSKPLEKDRRVNQPTTSAGHFNPSYFHLPQSPPPTYVNS